MSSKPRAARKRIIVATVLALCVSQAFAVEGGKDASAQTRQANAAVVKQLDFSDRQDFADAQRGFLGTIEMPIKSGDKVSWDLRKYDFLKSDKVPDTVNPSLWRIGQLNMNNGLFKVTDRVYQVRGFDLSNMTIIEGDTGLIVIDPLISTESAKAGLELYYKHRPKKPVVALIYTHSHVDHYGGAKGVISEADVKSGKVKVLAPEGFLDEAVSENVFAGNAMSRRSLYQYGAFLPAGARGQIDAGLGKGPSNGTITLIPPTDTITKTGETRNIDGVQMEFQMAPGTEAPSEMLIYFPQFKVLDAAEDATHTLHNLYTLRGAQVRDAVHWWKTLHTAIAAYGDKLDIVIAQHHWPTFGRERAVKFMGDQRDMFKYIHDQTLNLANKGYTPNEIGEMIKLPDSVGNKWYNRGYYGTVNHDAKAVYQRYLGWYDSNPANLYPLPPEEVGKKYVEAMGGADVVVKKARDAVNKGDYRWAAELAKHAVFADPNNKPAREVEADALEQLGYQTENPTWRNEFLMGAFELRNGVPKLSQSGTATTDVIAAMSPEMILDFTGIRLNGPKAVGKTARINWVQPEGKSYAIQLENGVLLYTADKKFDKPDATLTVDKLHFSALLAGGAPLLDKEVAAGTAKVDGSAAKIKELLGLLDTFPGMFNIVTP